MTENTTALRKNIYCRECLIFSSAFNQFCVFIIQCLCVNTWVLEQKTESQQ